MRSDGRDLRGVTAEGQKLLVVLEQGHRLGREPLGQVVAFSREGFALDRLFGNIRVVEQAQGELVAQHAAHGRVQEGLGHGSALHGFMEFNGQGAWCPPQRIGCSVLKYRGWTNPWYVAD